MLRALVVVLAVAGAVAGCGDDEPTAASSPVTAQLEGEEPLVADPGQTVRLRIEGRRAGRYPVDFGDAGEAVLVTGVDVGP